MALVVPTLFLVASPSYAESSEESSGDTDASSLVIAITGDRSPELLWTGLNASGDLLTLFADPLKPTFEEFLGRRATREEIKTLSALTKDGQLFDAETSYSGPTKLAMRFPGLALTRINLWEDGRAHEISIAGLKYAPEALQNYVAEVSRLAETAPPLEVPAVVLAVSLERTFGPEELTYAEVFRRNGKQFERWELAELEARAPEFARACRYPNTVEAIGKESLKWLESRHGPVLKEVFIAVDGVDLQLRVWLKPARDEEEEA